MAARRLGQLDMDLSVEMLRATPLDARQLVRTKDELLDPGSFAYGYNGMIVACRDEQKLYMLIDKDNPTLEVSWKEIGASSGGDELSALTDEEIAALIPA